MERFLPRRWSPSPFAGSTAGPLACSGTSMCLPMRTPGGAISGIFSYGTAAPVCAASGVAKGPIEIAPTTLMTPATTSNGHAATNAGHAFGWLAGVGLRNSCGRTQDVFGSELYRAIRDLLRWGGKGQSLPSSVGGAGSPHGGARLTGGALFDKIG